MQIFYTKMNLKMTSAKWQPYCLSLNVLIVEAYWDPLLLIWINFNPNIDE